MPDSAANSAPERTVPTPGALCCPVCDSREVTFDPIPSFYFRELERCQFVHSIYRFETINLERYTCAVCGAADRDRLYALYFRKALTDPSRRLSVLHFAPTPSLSSFLSRLPQLQVRTADLLMAGVDDTLDITDLSVYAEGQFDILICSHVLEHVPDDRQAMKELYRVLAKGGWGIVMAPIHLDLVEIEEDPSITDETLRWKYFAQYDHVRLYSKDGFVQRLKSVGFEVDQFGRDFFGDDVFRANAIDPRSVLYIVRK